MAGLDVSSLKPVGAQQQEAAPAGKLDVSKLRPAYTPAPAAAPTEPQTSLIEDIGFGASRVGTAIPHLAEFALDVPQHIGAAAQWGVSGEMTGASADRPDIAQNFDTFAASKLGSPDFKAFPARGYDPAKLSGLYQEFLTQAPNAELHKRLTQGRLPEAYKAPLLGTDVFGGQLGAAAEGIKGITGGAVDLNKAFPEAKNKKQQAIEGTVEGIVTGGTSIPRSIARAALPQVFKKVGRVEADALRREVVTDMLTGGVGGYTGTVAAQNAPEGWELPASLVGGMAGGLGAIGTAKAAGAVTDKVGGYLRPAITTKGNVERMTGEALRNAAADPNRAVDEMAAATAPEGVEFTTGQASQDIGLLNLEQTLARGKDQKFREAMVQRAREQNAALANAVRGIEQGASPSAMTSFFNDRMGQLNERLDQLDANARKLAQQEAAGLETPDAGDVGGNLQDALAGEMDRVKQEVAALDKAVDPTGTMRLPTGRLRTSAADIYADMSPEERLSITAEEKALLAVINGYGDTIPYQRFRDLRTQLNEDMRNARSAGKGRAYGRMSQMRGALEADIADAISGRFAREANAANEFVARARDWYERGAEAPARPAAAASPVGAAPGATPAVPPRAGEPGAAGREPGAPAGDTGLPEDAAARAAVEGRRFSQGEIIQLGERREQKQLEGFHRNLMGQIGDQVRASREATAAAREKGMFEGFNVGDRLRSQNHKGEPLPPMKIEGVFMREWNPNRVPPMFERLGITPTIAEYGGKQYVPMIRYSTGEAPPPNLTGKQLDDWQKAHPDQDWQRGETYLDAVRDRKMGGMRLAQSEAPAETKPAFYSAALKSVEDSKTNRASPQQWAATIKNTPGVKQEEIDWLGLTPWLAQQKGAVTKEQVADFIRANQIEVEEVNLAGQGSDEALGDLGRRLSWEPDDVDEDFVREIAAERAVDEEDDYRERISNREDIDPGEVTEDQILQMAFEDEMRWRTQEPDGYHASVTVDTPDGQVTYELNRDSNGDTSIYVDGRNVVDYRYMDEGDIRDALRQDYEENYTAAKDADGPTEYGQYTLPGGKDYHELLLKLPERERADVTRPSAEVQEKYKAVWDLITAKMNDERVKTQAATTTEDYRAGIQRQNALLDEQDALHKKMVEETRASAAPWKQGENFSAKPHFVDSGQDQNILAHVRFKDRTSVDGKRTLFLEEVQSDWHQQGRDKGYKREPTADEVAEMARLDQAARDAQIAYRKEVDAVTDGRGYDRKRADLIREYRDASERGASGEEMVDIDRRITQLDENRRRIESGDARGAAAGARARADEYRAQLVNGNIPDAPFKTTWPELALKRMIRWAADNGYDQIAWTPGNVQNKRYNLSKQIDRIGWDRAGEVLKRGTPDADKLITIETSRGQMMTMVVDADGKVVKSSTGMQAEGKPLTEVLGKDLAQQIMADADGEITKAGLAEIGGSGMREFYDRVLVSLGNKLGKKFGTQVGKTELEMPQENRSRLAPSQRMEVPALPITDAMRAGAQQGFPLFQKVNEAATSPLNDLPQPTEAQKEAGNYKKGRVRLGGLDISIENPAGSKRSGTDTAGKAWSVDMKDHYGYIRGTVGRDKDHLDTFVARDAGELTNDSPVFVVNQLDPKTRKFDEHKIMLGYPNRAAAEAAYKANYAKDWQGMGSIIPTNLGALKSWIADGNTKRPFEQRSIPDAQGSVGAGGVRGVPGEAAPAAGNAGREADGSLRGLPRKIGSLTASAYPDAQRVAAAYMKSAGLEYRPPNTYAKVDPERATRIAAAYDAMEHNPSDPAVQRAYKAMADETLAQYQAMLDDGMQIEFIAPDRPDPYAGNPRNMTEDVRKNKHMWVFATRDGFGSDATFDVSDNPLLGESGFEISGQPATINDIFRAVHDYFGHVKEGVGFRADGEENAWRAHSAMYSPEARRAMTSETRGQNSWVNYWPFGETNRTAKSEDTHYADQKIGLLPEWVAQEGAGDDTIADTMAQRFASAGRPEPEAKAAGQIVEAFYTTLANRLGVEADAVEKQFPLPVVRRAGDAGGLKQGSKPKAERNLYAVHNIKPGGVLNAAKIGGLPMPSLAIARADKGDFGNFGDISLIGSPRLIDPKGGAGAKTYDADVYSPRYPSVTRSVNDKAFSALNKRVIAVGKEVGGDGYRVGLDLSRLEDRGPAEAADATGLKRLFLQERGIAPEVIKKADGEPDFYANEDAINAALKPIRAEYDEWAAAQLEPLVERERIFKGFDYNGNRRYREHNIDNVLSDMRARLKEGEGFMYGVGTIRSKHAKQFRSLDAIRKDKDRITGTDQMTAEKDEFGDRFFELADEMKPYYRFDAKAFQYADDVAGMFGDMAKKGTRALDEGFADLPKDIVDKVRTYLADLANAPTEYFETKINRNVGLGEFEAALVPTGTAPRVVEALKKAGLRIVEYDKSAEGARTEAIRKLDEERGPDDPLMFQGERGSILLGRDGAPALISLFETADATTALHESAHQFLDMFSRVAGGKGAPEGLLRDWNATKAWWQKNAKQLAEDAGEGITPADVRKALAGESLGAKKDAAVARGMHEQWARAFEVYLRDGKAPNAQMKGLFDQFKDWLTQVYQSITGMGIDLSPDIRGVFDRMLGAEGGDIIDRPAAKRLSDVTQRWKDYYGTYTDKAAGPVPAIVRKSKGESYPFDMPPEAVTKATWKPGPDGATAIRNILKAAGQDRAAAVKGIEQSAMLSLTRAALKDGVVDPAAFDKWKATHSDALAAMPELAKRLSNAADATRAMQKVAKQALDTRQAVERSAVGSILKLGADASDADISRKIGGMIGRQDAVKNMRELVNQARGEPEALAGLRRAVVDYALMQFTREENLSAAAMKRWMARNRPALETVLDPAQMQTLNAVVAASDRISNIVRAPGGGSPTAEYLMSLSKREKPSMLREMLSHAFANAVQSGLVGGVGHVLGGLGVGINTALGAFLSRAGIDALRARGFAKVHDLMLEAILDPELGRTLMMKAAKEKGKGSARVLERTLASGLIGAIGGGREQARERAATGG